MTRLLPLLASVVLIMGQVPTVYAQLPYSDQIMLYDNGHISQISDAEYGQVWEPRINERGDIVWTSEAEGLHLYDGTSITLLSSSTPSHAEIGDMGHVVWEESDGEDPEIFLYDGTDTLQLTDDTDYIGDKFPQVNNRGEVAWLRGHGAYVSGEPYTYDVFLYDGTEMIQLMDDTHNDFLPKLNNSGQVVWIGGTDAPYYTLDEQNEVLFYNGTATIQLTNNSYYDGNPQINDEGHVVWEGFDGNDSEIFLYDGTTVLQLTNNLRHDFEPQLNNNGQVVWSCGEVTLESGEIVLYDGTNARQLTNDVFYDHHPMVSDDGHVVWTRQYLPLSFGIGAALFSQEIMVYDGSKVESLSKNLFLRDSYPDMNAHGHVVWESSVFQPWQASSVIGADPDDISEGLNYSLAILLPLGIVALWRRFRNAGVARQ